MHISARSCAHAFILDGSPIERLKGNERMRLFTVLFALLLFVAAVE